MSKNLALLCADWSIVSDCDRETNGFHDRCNGLFGNVE